MKTIILLLGFILGSHADTHDIHVSITEIQRASDGHLEVSISTFKDDLQNAVGLAQGAELSQDYQGSDALIKKYVEAKLILFGNQGSIGLQYQESIPSGDAVWIYLKSKNPVDNVQLEIQNSFMLELFSDQSNITKIKGSTENTLLLNHKKTNAKFKI